MKTINSPYTADHKTRLYAVDSFEKDQSFGKAATEYTRKWLAENSPDGIYDEVPHGRDVYGRTLSVIKAPNGRVLNEDLVSAGFALSADKSDSMGYHRLQEDAAKNKKGAWASGFFISPSVHRKNENISSRGLRGPDATGMALALAELGLKPQADPSIHEPDASFPDLLKAAFFKENSFYDLADHVADKIVNPIDEVDLNFDSTAFIAENPAFVPYAETLALTSSRAEAMSALRSIRKDEKALADLATVGGLERSIYMLGAMAADPLWALPALAGPSKLVAVAPKVFKSGKVLKSAAVWGGYGLGAEALPETIKSGFQESRTGTESAINIVASGLFEMVGGSIAAKMLGNSNKKMIKSYRGWLSDDANFEKELTDQFKAAEKMAQGPLHEDIVKGQISRRLTRIRDMAEASDTSELVGALGLENIPMNPIVGAMKSNSGVYKTVVNALVENPLIVAAHKAGKAVGEATGSVVSRAKLLNSKIFEPIEQMRDAWKGMKKKGIHATELDYNLEIGRKLLMGETAGDAVAEGFLTSLRFFQQEMAALDPALKAAVTKDLDKSILRVFNTEAMVNNPAGVKDLIARHVADTLRKQGSHSGRVLSDTVDDIYRKMVEHPNMRDWNLSFRIGKRKYRGLSFLENDALLPFLHTDPRVLIESYGKRFAADIELLRTFGSTDLKTQKSLVREEYGIYRKAMQADGADQTALDMLQKEELDSLDDLNALVGVFRGTYTKGAVSPHSKLGGALRMVRKGNVLRLLGGQTISAMTDPAFVVMTNGLGNTLKALREVITRPSQYKMAARDAKMQFAIWENLDAANRISMMADTHQPYQNVRGIERQLDKAVGRFSFMNLMTPWNQKLKEFAALTTSHRLLTDLESLGKGTLAPKALARLRAAGIHESMDKTILAQLDEFGERGDNLWLPKTDAWADADAALAFRSAITKEVDRAIVTPGLGDTPLFMQREEFKTMFQFKSFAMAFHSKMLLSGLQMADMQFMNGVLLATALGGMVYGLKSNLRGVAVSDDPKVWFREAFDQSGVHGILGDANNTMEKLVYGAASGRAMSARYLNRNVADVLAGPTAGFGRDVFDVVKAAASGHWSRADVHSARKLAAGQNLFYLYNLINVMETHVGDQL